ncbi:MAG: DNA polymerase III subunit alpha, partial [Chloroflexi bacterium]|nr:DNA polymerase III subunit alpha [Chloroflexota bacterium]
MPTEDFVHLHVHSEYSLLDGLSKIKHLIARAKALGQPALALTDHGNMHGAIDFFNAATAAEVQPIIGVEAYLTKWGRPMTGRDSKLDRMRHHILLLAQNQTGYKNLIQLVSKAELEGFYHRPRFDAEMLAAYSEGLICTSGCIGAEVPYYLNDEKNPANPSLALERLQWYLDVFGRDRFYIELQEHDIPALHKVNKTLLDWSQRYDVGLVVTNDVHYVQAEDATPHDILLCVQTSSTYHDPSRMRMSDSGYYLKSRAELMDAFRPYADLPASAFSNTVKIAEMCHVDLRPKGYHLPEFPVPAGYTDETFLRHLTEEGVRRRYGDRTQDATIQQRKEHELKIIHQMGFDTYYLIVWDLCEYARKNNIWWNVRGSGAGSLVAYVTGITNLDPLPNHLIFERFLNPGRVSMPDFDLDYPDDQREQMIEYTIQKYGEDRVAQIVVFGTMKARGSIRDTARALEIPLEEVDSIAKLIPGGPKVTIEKSLKDVTDLRERYEKEAKVRELIDHARKLEGVARHVSIHPAAVIVADKPLTEYTPLRHSPAKGLRDYITQYTYPVLESIGLLKLDFLGLSTLSIMREAAKLIQERHGVEYQLDNIPTDDPRSYELLSSGEVTGIFQVESEGMRNMLRKMRPSRFEHIIAAISLYRPGPMEFIGDYVARMHGQKPVEYKHPALEPILKETFGIIVYQEQIIQIAAQLAGYTPSEADLMRRAVAKKKEKEMALHRIKFVEGAVVGGIPEYVAQAIFGDIDFFANYGFNKSHAADYAVITVQTAFLKSYYPVEYMTALLTVELNDQDKVSNFINECRAMGIAVLPPDINVSELGFKIQDNVGDADSQVSRQSGFNFPVPAGAGIRFGLGAVKNVGQGPVEEILRARGDGPFTSLEDFCERVDLRLVNRRALESLIKVGALAQFGDREMILAVLDKMMQLSSHAWQAKDVGQLMLFDIVAQQASAGKSQLLDPPPQYTPVSARERLDWEKTLLGVYVSDHPLLRITANLGHVITCLSNEVTIERAGKAVVMAGMIAGIRPYITKKGDRMAFVTLQDLQGTCDVTVFPRTYANTPAHLLEEGAIILVRGKVELNKERINVIADTISEDFTVAMAATADNSLPSFASSAPPPPWEDEDDKAAHYAVSSSHEQLHDAAPAQGAGG